MHRRALVPWVVALAGCGDANPTLSRSLVSEKSLAYPSSTAILDVVFDDSSVRTAAPGSDNWPITWAENGHLYTSWGDGGGFGGTNSSGRVSLGIGRVEGAKGSYVGYNVAGGVNAPDPSPFPGKSEGILAIGNTLYLWRNGDGSGTAAFKYSKLYRSDDLGAHWSYVGVELSEASGDFPGGDKGFFSIVFCQFGRGYAGARDAYVYMYATEIIDTDTWDVQMIPGRIVLLRVPVSDLEDENAYQVFAGLASGGTPTWSANLGDRVPAWEDPVGGAHRSAVSYNAGLGLYLLTSMTIDRDGRISIYEAPEPWGPWSTVLVEWNTQRWGNKAIIFSFVNKWLSSDGTQFVIAHTGCCDSNDHWATIEGRFVIDSGPPPTCNDGQTQVCGSTVGACSQGTQTCVGGVWAACSGSVGPTTETCNGLDDDCNGGVDEPCDCIDGDLGTCGVDVGACAAGERVCVGGHWTACSGGVESSEELCNGVDDDCDGETDEGCDDPTSGGDATVGGDRTLVGASCRASGQPSLLVLLGMVLAAVRRRAGEVLRRSAEPAVDL